MKAKEIMTSGIISIKKSASVEDVMKMMIDRHTNVEVECKNDYCAVISNLSIKLYPCLSLPAA